MPPFILGLLPLLRRNWRIFALIGLLGCVFASGWKVNGWRLENHYTEQIAERERIMREAAADANAALKQIYEARAEASQKAARQLERDLQHLRAQNADLVIEIEGARLVKPSNVTCTDNDTGEIHEIQPNPFSDNFVDLWNSVHDD